MTRRCATTRHGVTRCESCDVTRHNHTHRSIEHMDSTHQEKIYDAVAATTHHDAVDHTRVTKKFYTRRDEGAKRSHIDCDSHIKNFMMQSHHTTCRKKKISDTWATRSQCAAHTSDKFSHMVSTHMSILVTEIRGRS